MMDSIEKYPLHENPYFLESLDQYIDLINQSYANAGSKQTVTIVSMESVLNQAGLSKKTIEKIMGLNGTDFCDDAAFIRMDGKNESNLLDSLVGDVDKKGYYEVSTKEKSATDKEAVYYVGKLKKNRPQGEGALFIFDDNGISLQYAGGFKDGRYDGKGVGFRRTGFGYDMIVIGNWVKNENSGKAVLYDDTDVDGVYAVYFSMFDEYSSGKLNEYSETKQREIMERVLKKNPACRIATMIGFYPVTATTVQLDLPVIKPVEIYSGNFKNNRYQKGKLYDSTGILKYEGEFKNGRYNGNGILYYGTGETVKYKGSFKNGQYHGKGTLYNEDGSVRKTGNFKHEKTGSEIEDVMSSLSSSITMALYTTWAQKGSEYFFEPESMQDQENEQLVPAESNSEDYVLPGSDYRYYSQRELEGYSKEQLRLGRNEIYARHGRIFTSEDLNAYFQSKSWYHGYLTADQFDESVLNEYEKENLILIKELENQ